MPTNELFEKSTLTTQEPDALGSSKLGQRGGAIEILNGNGSEGSSGESSFGSSTLRDNFTKFPDEAGDKIVIDSPGGVKNILSERSLNRNRPDILVCTRFKPGFKNNNPKSITTTGEMLRLQYNARNLMVDDTATIIAELETAPSISTDLQNLNNNYEELRDQVENRLSLLSDILTNLDKIKTALDIKDNAGAIQAEVANIRAGRGQITDLGVKTTPPLGQFSNLKQIIHCQLGFSAESYGAMSNSRIYGQLIADLFNSLMYYSPKLVSSFSQEREDDRDAIFLKSTTVQDDDFTFVPKDLSSEPTTALGQSIRSDIFDFDPLKFNDFSSLIDALPMAEVDRIKLLTVILSRELRMSSGIARLIGTPLGKKYTPESSGGLLERIIGETGDKIIGNLPLGGTLASLLRIKDSIGRRILPFERRAVIDPDVNQKHLPGSVFFVDTILQNDNRPDTSAINDYVDNMSEIVDDATKALGFLLNFDDTSEKLHFETVIKEIYSDVAQIIDNALESGFVQKSSSIGLALINAAQDDASLRHKLFLYTQELRTGVITTTHVSDASDDNTGGSETGGGKDIPPTGVPGPRTGGILGFDEIKKEFEGALGDTTKNVGRDPKRTHRAGHIPRRLGDLKTKTGVIQDTVNDIGSVVLGDTSLPAQIEAIVNDKFRVTHAGSIQGVITDVSIPNGEIEAVLNNGVQDTALIFNKIAELADKFNADAIELTSSGPATQILPTAHKNDRGLTLYTRYSDNTILMLVFEIVCNIVSEFVPTNFTNANITSTSLSVTINEAQNEAVSDQMKVIVGRLDENSANIGNDYTTFTGIIESIHSSLIQEDAIIRDIIDVIKAISATINSAVASAIDFFNLNKIGETAESLKTLFNDPEYAEILRNIEETQVALSWQGMRTIFSSEDQSLLPTNQIITRDQFRALNSMLRSPRFGTGAVRNAKVLTVGFPVGMLEALRNPPFIIGENVSLETEASDLITLKVYKRDPEFSDVIFKPQTFLFDLSRFAKLRGTISKRTGFNKVLNQNFVLANILGTKGIKGSKNLKGFKALNEYNLLTDDQKFELFQNHATNALLQLYVKLLTGMTLDEFTFLANESILLTKEIDPQVQTILKKIEKVIDSPESKEIINALRARSSLSNVLITSFSRIIDPTTAINNLFSLSTKLGSNSNESLTNDSDATDNVVETEEKDPEPIDQALSAALEAQFKRLLNGLFFRTTEQKIRVEQPKLFERVFSVLVDPDDFEIDLDKTLDTVKGRRAFNKTGFQSCIIDETNDEGNRVVKLKPRSAKEGNFEFTEFFVVASLGVDV